MQGGEDTKPSLGEYSDVEQRARGYIVLCMQCSIWTLSIKYMCKHESDAIYDISEPTLCVTDLQLHLKWKINDRAAAPPAIVLEVLTAAAKVLRAAAFITLLAAGSCSS